MRIALVSQEYPPETAHGGIGTQTYAKAHGLAELGHDVHVISHSTDPRQHEYRDGDVLVVRIPGVDSRLPVYTEAARWLTYSVEVASAIAELHARSPLALVDFPEWGAEAFTHLANRSPWNRIPATVQLHGPLVMLAHTIAWPEKDSDFYRLGTMMEGACLKMADAVYSSSNCSAQWCARHYGLDVARIPVLHTGVDTDLFHPAASGKDERLTIIFVGKLERNKGVDLLTEAVCRLAPEFPGLRLRLLGRGDPKVIDALRARARQAGHPELLDVAGFVPRQELPAELCRAHVFAAPSLYEGGPGFVYLEAMACGLPVIACAGSGAAEVVRPEENGLLTPPGDVPALVNALQRLLADRRRRQTMGQAARQYVIDEADSKTCILRLERFFRAAARQE